MTGIKLPSRPHPCVLALALGLLASACTSGGERGTADAPRTGDAGAAESSAPTPADRASAEPPSRDEYIRRPLAISERTISTVTAAFGAPARIEAQPIENRHVAGQIDTLVTLRYGDAAFEFYRVANGREFLNYAVVESDRYLRYARPGIGTPVDSLLAWFGEPSERRNGRLVYSRRGAVGAEQPVVFAIEDGHIRRIEVMGYVD